MPFYSIHNLASEFSKARATLVEQHLVRLLEQHLNRVPSNSEMQANCIRCISPDREEFFWKSHFLFGALTSFAPLRVEFYFDQPHFSPREFLGG